MGYFRATMRASRIRRARIGPRVMNPVKYAQAVDPAARAWRALSGASMPPVALRFLASLATRVHRDEHPLIQWPPLVSTGRTLALVSFGRADERWESRPSLVLSTQVVKQAHHIKISVTEREVVHPKSRLPTPSRGRSP